MVKELAKMKPFIGGVICVGGCTKSEPEARLSHTLVCVMDKLQKTSIASASGKNFSYVL